MNGTEHTTFEKDAAITSDAELGMNALDSLELAAGTVRGIEGIVSAMCEYPSEIDGDMLQIVIDSAYRARKRIERAERYIETERARR